MSNNDTLKEIEQLEKQLDTKSKEPDPIEKYIKDVCKQAGMSVEKLRSGLCGGENKSVSEHFHQVRDGIIRKLASGDFGHISQTKIGEYLGVSVFTINVRMRKNNIPLLTKSGRKRKDVIEKMDTQPEESELKINLDFTEQPEIYEKICDVAKKQFRTPENQLMWWLTNCDYEKILEKGNLL